MSKGGRAAQRADARQSEIAAVAVETLAEVELSGLALAAADGAVCAGLKRDGVAVAPWARFAVGQAGAAPWPADRMGDAGVLRLPGGWEAFRMTLHALCARLPEGAPLWIYGGAEEGIVSAPNHLAGLVENVETVALKKRTRVLRGIRTGLPAKGEQADWRSVHDIAVPGVTDPLRLAFYPGCFASGRLDEGTRLLLQAAGPVKEGARVLDFASGVGVVAAALRARTPDLWLTLCDADALALDAAAENVPGAEIVLSDGPDGVAGAARFDLIVSNPPIHVGRQEDFAVLAALLERGPKLLRPKGSLVFVTQRTAGVGRLIAAQKRKADLLAETPAFQVWRVM